MDFIFNVDHVLNNQPRRARLIQERTDYFDLLDDLDFETRFRLSKRSALNILERIEDHLEFPTDKYEMPFFLL